MRSTVGSEWRVCEKVVREIIHVDMDGLLRFGRAGAMIRSCAVSP